MPKASNARPPASAQVVARAEKTLDAKLPALLRDYYTRVANGGVGPHGGILGLTGGYGDDSGRDAIALYERWRRLPNDSWPKGLHFIAYTGCTNYLCTDLMDAKAPVVEFDASLLPEDFETITPASFRRILMKRAASLDEWMKKHAAPVLKQIADAPAGSRAPAAKRTSARKRAP